jgi:hypothetical protein
MTTGSDSHQRLSSFLKSPLFCTQISAVSNGFCTAEIPSPTAWRGLVIGVVRSAQPGLNLSQSVPQISLRPQHFGDPVAGVQDGRVRPAAEVPADPFDGR